MDYYVLFNPLAGAGRGKIAVEKVRNIITDGDMTFQDIREIKSFSSFFKGIRENDIVVVAGGDGTLNRFLNAIDGLKFPNRIYYFAIGSGNDFKADVAPGADSLIPMEQYMKDLPIVSVNGKKDRFLNGIGYGIDGYCCEVGDDLAKKSDKPINYAGIAIKGLLFHFKPLRATITVDGKSQVFDDVWLAPTMNGRYYGGGMKIAPNQNRLNPEKTVSLVVLHCHSKIKTLVLFPSIFKGEHIKHTEMVSVLEGREIRVQFDRPTALQIDGETVRGVTEYTVLSGTNVTTANSIKD